MEILKKITVKNVVGAIGRDVEKPDHGKKVVLMQVFGDAQRFVEKSTQLGPYLEFIGRFRAINVATGESFDSARLILPEVAQDILGAQFIDSGDTNMAVQFAFGIGIKGDDSAVTKYVYHCEPLIKAEADSDPLSRLQEQLTESGKLSLPAPEADTNPAAKSGKKSGKKK